MNLPIARRYVAPNLPFVLTAAGAAMFAQSKTSTAKMATSICRPGHSVGLADASMTKSTTELVCEPFAVSMRPNDGYPKTIGNTTVEARLGPDVSGAPTSQQFGAAYNTWFMRALHIDPATEQRA